MRRSNKWKQITIIALSLLASAITPPLNGRSNESQKPVWKLRQRFGRRLWEHIDKMSYHKIKAEFEVGDLVHLEAYNIDIYTNDNKKLAVVISGPNYGKSMTYQDWEVLDEPMYDILCEGRVQTNIPQRFMEKVTKK